ncbi:thioredoxin-disulfide reductase [Phyllobacterium brassicacearum]|uniref:Thioredoxin reductase n=1 Tax=Phyllobacterium brassicacearum TaxID=314235 RepID=A0A2P7BUY0_9HYPH|nr:thioredoxin-disulfide reductase [Phyllobacterium brassicacearum]PSH70256.1 thioredoxin-disulfide reductase [Phyllobacterium brassicacearum]TDQ33850.1 thioredoxin reductase (NADPH) [Phyllobacterium brassicacearum]
MSTHHTKVLIIGAGPTGYTAAIYAARANLKPLLLTGIQPGGQLTITTDVENYPGFAEPVQGPWLMEQMRQQAVNVGTQLVYDTITSVDLSKRPFRAQGDSGDTYVADGLIIATGAQARWLGIPSEVAFNGYGVSACATCDGFFYRDKEVVVVGGGNTAVEEALYLSKIASKVTVIHRRDRFRAEPILQDRLLAKPNVEVVWNHVVEEVLGEHEPTKSVTGVRIRDVRTGQTKELPTDGVFVAIGHDPATALFRGQLDMDEAGYIKVGSWSTKTSVPGCQAAGDVIDPVFRQAISSAGMGCMAALEADKFLAEYPSDPDK